MAELKRNTVPGEKPAAAEKTRVSGIRGLLACSRSTKRNLVTYTMVVLAYVVVQVLIGTKVISLFFLPRTRRRMASTRLTNSSMENGFVI